MNLSAARLSFTLFFVARPAAFVKIFSIYWASLSEIAERDRRFLQKFSMSGRPVMLKNPIFCRLSAIVSTVEFILERGRGV